MWSLILCSLMFVAYVFLFVPLCLCVCGCMVMSHTHTDGTIHTPPTYTRTKHRSHLNTLTPQERCTYRSVSPVVLRDEPQECWDRYHRRHDSRCVGISVHGSMKPANPDRVHPRDPCMPHRSSPLRCVSQTSATRRRRHETPTCR
jgi:hypothetical protein